MGSVGSFLFVYFLGGLTFFPLVLSLVFLFIYLSLPDTPTSPSQKQQKQQQQQAENADAAAGKKKKKVTPAQLRVQRGTLPLLSSRINLSPTEKERRKKANDDGDGQTSKNSPSAAP